jgi:phosphatidylethanolamine/phosphatidyl-N-methylethanolamine N-methyltransferase
MEECGMQINSNRWNRIRYGLYAPFYDIIAGIFIYQRKRSVDQLDLHPGNTLLIVGAGTGLDLSFMPKDINITAIDITPSMIERLNARAKSLNVPVTACVMDGQQLLFPDQVFDRILLNLIVAVIPDPHLCLLEAKRVLRENGKIVIFDKFLPDDASPSLMRRIINFFTKIFFSDINRQIGVLLSDVHLSKISEESAGFGGIFRIISATKG